MDQRIAYLQYFETLSRFDKALHIAAALQALTQTLTLRANVNTNFYKALPLHRRHVNVKAHWFKGQVAA